MSNMNFFFFLFLFTFFFSNIVVCENYEMENDFVGDLLKMDIFEQGTTKLKKEIYEQINDTHFAFSICKVCIKIIKLFNKIIERTKEKYIDVAIEEALETDLCDSKIWTEYFNFNEIIYNEHILEFCEYTLKQIKNDIIDYVYDLYKDEKLFIKTVCEKLYSVCYVAIKEEDLESDINYENNENRKIKYIFQLYSDYLVNEKNFEKTTDGLPYKIKHTKAGNLKLKRDYYILIQSKIKVLHKDILLNDFKDNIYRLLKVDDLDEKIQRLFLLMMEQYEFDFFYFLQFCKNKTLPSDSLFEIKVKIHKIAKKAIDIKPKDNEQFITNNENFLLRKHPCSN